MPVAIKITINLATSPALVKSFTAALNRGPGPKVLLLLWCEITKCGARASERKRSERHACFNRVPPTVVDLVFHFSVLVGSCFKVGDVLDILCRLQ